MRNSNAKDRSPLILGATIFVTLATILIVCCAGRFGANTNDTAEKGSEEICTSIMTSTTQTTSIQSSTTTSTAVTSTKKTTTTTKTETAITTEPVTTQAEIITEPVTEPVVTEPATQTATEPAPVEEPTEPVYVQEPVEQVQPLPYNESDAVLLAQLINKESSVNWDGMIAVADCVVNRANINGLTISQVIYAPGQFTTAYSLGYYNTDNYNAAVQVLTYGSTNTAIYFFDGNHGGLNWFYDINRNYLFAA